MTLWDRTKNLKETQNIEEKQTKIIKEIKNIQEKQINIKKILRNNLVEILMNPKNKD